jgi:preprotein translocase subunit SecG
MRRFVPCLETVSFVSVGNLFTGPLPSEIGLLDKALLLYIFDNMFTGTVISELAGMRSVVQLLFSDNYFTSTLPSTLAKCTNLQELSVNSNFISGSLPTSYARMPKFTSINMSTNLFEGRILETMFLPNTSIATVPYVPSPSLTLFDFSRNQLTGTLPDALFNRTDASLQSLLLFENCFSGTIPTSLCSSAELSVLVMDSLSSVGSCSINIANSLKPFVKAVFSRMRLRGSLPNCLWNMSQLQVLHFASNGLTGTIGDIASPFLVDVSLSNNNLIGTIPSSFQEFHFFSQLDLSNNKLSGILTKQFALNVTTTQLDLTVNRLSGPIPDDIIKADHINILNGNLFQCQTSNMPVSDPDRKSADCGSKNFNESMIVWGTLMMVAIACIFLLPIQFLPQAIEFHNHLTTQHEATVKLGGSLQQCMHFMTLLRILAGAVVAVAVFAVVGCMFTYIGLKDSANGQYATISQQYAWTTTVAFMHGLLPTAVVMMFFIIASLIMNNLMLWYVSMKADNELGLGEGRMAIEGQRSVIGRFASLKGMAVGDALYSIFPAMQYWSIAGVMLAHAIVTITINVLYVLALLESSIGSNAVIVVQLFLSVFKLTWVYSMGKLVRRIDDTSKYSRLVTYTWLYLISFMVGPFIATFFSEDTCFHEVFAGQDAVTSLFTITSLGCESSCFDLDCTSSCGFDTPLTISTTVSPSWSYSYQCSSTLLQDYVPVFILSYTLSGVILPTLSLLVSYPLAVLDHTLLLPESVRYQFSDMLIGVRSAALLEESSQVGIISAATNFFWGETIDSDGGNEVSNRRSTLTDKLIATPAPPVRSIRGSSDSRSSSIVGGHETTLNSEFDHRCSEIEAQTFRSSGFSNPISSAEDNDHINYLYGDRMGSGTEDSHMNASGDATFEPITASSVHSVKFAAAAFPANSRGRNTIGKQVSKAGNDAMQGASASRVFDSSQVIAKFLMNWTIVLTFGLTSPILALTVAVDSCAMILVWRATLRRWLDSISASVAASSQVTGPADAAFLRSLQKIEVCSDYTLNGIKVCIFMIIIASSWFWSIFFFDMVGDVDGFQAGGFTVLCFILVMPFVLWLNNSLIQWWYEGSMDWMCRKENTPL